jgi:hypothetical protein
VLTEAGFADVSIARAEVPCVWGRDADDAVSFYFSMGPVAFNLSGVDEATVTRVRAEVRAALREFETPAGVSVQGTIRVVTATRP